jgi:class 3 adenylate cyclase
VAELNYCFKAFDEITTRHNLEKIKTIGDAYLAVCGLPLADEGHAIKTVRAALGIRDFMQEYKAQRQRENKLFFELRLGINSGVVVAGIVGIKKYAYDIWGDTVNMAARMEEYSEAGKINISQKTYELVKDQFKCIHRGKIEAKHKGEIDMYFVEGGIVD